MIVFCVHASVIVPGSIVWVENDDCVETIDALKDAKLGSKNKSNWKPPCVSFLLAYILTYNDWLHLPDLIHLRTKYSRWFGWALRPSTNKNKIFLICCLAFASTISRSISVFIKKLSGQNINGSPSRRLILVNKFGWLLLQYAHVLLTCTKKQQWFMGKFDTNKYLTNYFQNDIYLTTWVLANTMIHLTSRKLSLR